jgi:hypothetical protein
MRPLLLALGILLVGCDGERPAPSPHYVSHGDWPSSEDYAVSRDNFKKQLSVRGPDTVNNDREPSKVCLRSISGADFSFRQIYFTMRSSSDWIFYDQVVTDSGRQLECHKINQQLEDRSMPWCREEVAADVPDDLFSQAQTSGLQVRIYGQRGSKDFEIPASYWQAFAAKEKVERTSAPPAP